VHGTWPEQTAAEGNTLTIGESSIRYASDQAISKTAWRDCDIVVEATGVHHKSPERLNAYFEQGVKKVIVAAPTAGALNIVYGVNDNLYDAEKHHLLTAASCTTNCLAPVVKVMH